MEESADYPNHTGVFQGREEEEDRVPKENPLRLATEKREILKIKKSSFSKLNLYQIKNVNNVKLSRSMKA